MATTNLYAEALKKFQQDVLDRHKDSDTRRLLNDFLKEGRSSFATPDAAKQAAGELATDAGQKFSGLKIGRVEVVPKSWIDNVLGNINKIVDVGSTVVSKAPESIGMAWFAISLTLKAIGNNYALYALFGTGLTDITEVMIVIVHYDRLYDERQKSGFKDNDLVDKLFRDTASAYAAVLDFAFSVKKHMSGGTMDKLKHGFKDFFNAQAPKFEGKLASIATLKAKILESSQGVFQEKTMQQFGDARAAIEEVQQQQQQAIRLGIEQREILGEMYDSFKEIKDLVKQQKTPWQLLKDEFEATKKKLAPLADPYQGIGRLLAGKHEDTCKWVLEDEKYQGWANPKENTILCFTGGPGSGKSTVLAALVEQLGPVMNADAPFINYVSCSENDNSQAATLEGQKLSKIHNTLLYQIYELAIQDDTKVSLLATCNQILRDPKGHKAAAGRGGQNDGLPDFANAMIKLVTALQTDTILVIDAVGILSREDQNELYDSLQELLHDTQNTQSISVLVSSRADSTFVQRSLGTIPCINLSNSNDADMETVLDTRLSGLPGWSGAERQLAKEKVLEMAGSSFSYIDAVAVPFLKQPFQRPVSNYLRNLPKGINQSYEQAIRSMPPNYFELLKLAVTWCLLAPRAVTVKEIIEAYSRVYDKDEAGNYPEITMDDDSYTPMATDLEVQQLGEASGPFLVTERTEDGQIVVKLQDARQVQNFCDPANEEHATQILEGSQNCNDCKYCQKCRSSFAKPSSLTIDPKVAHYEIAVTLLRHLNNPLFQKRFGLLEKSAETEAVEVPVEGSEATTSKDDKEDVGTIAATVMDEPRAEEHDVAKQLEALLLTQADGEEPDEEKQAALQALYDDLLRNVVPQEVRAAEVHVAEPEIRDRFLDDTSMAEDFIDLEEEEYEEDDADSSPIVDMRLLFDCAPHLRCEVNNWPYHLLEAEKLWSHDERRDNPLWAQYNDSVQEELAKFVSNVEVFQNWQRIFERDRYIGTLQNGPVPPLHMAACLGLGTWAERLIDNGADILEIANTRTVMQSAGDLADGHLNVELLSLLLKRGADIYHNETENLFCGLNIWLTNADTVEIVKALSDHNADFTFKDEGGWTPLHVIAWYSSNVESFHLVMNSGSVEKSPDINAADNDGETPLHKLLCRANTSIDLLKAFLAVEGIDVNHDDRDSQQPLAVASSWGSLKVVELLLEAGADVLDTDDNVGRIALHLAAGGGHVKCMRALLDAHSDIESKDNYGSTPLHYAAYYGHKAAVELLIERGGDLLCPNNRGRTPLFEATRCATESEETAQVILTELKKRGCTAGRVNQVTEGGRTPLRQAAAHGFANILKELLEYINGSGDADVKATINKSDNSLVSSRTPLHCAAARGSPDCVRSLIQHGADPSPKSSTDATPLMLALEQWTQRNEPSFEDVILQLIDCDHDAAVDNAELPSIAAAAGSVKVLQKLHSLRADLSRVDSFGWTPIAHAKQSGHKEAEYFLKHETSWGGNLPSRWIDHKPLGILDDNGLKVTYKIIGDRVCIISDKPLPPNIERFYFEVTIETLGEYDTVAIGFCTLNAQAHVFPGWRAQNEAPYAKSWGYHSDDGCIFPENATGLIETGEPYGVGDTVGCGVDLETRKMWFTKNGKILDKEFNGVRGRLSPILGLRSTVTLETNFGRQPFKWKYQQLENGEAS